MSDWIEWKGGECPVPDGTLVEVKYRDGFQAQFYIPDVNPWNGINIVAYRIVEPADKYAHYMAQKNRMFYPSYKPAEPPTVVQAPPVVRPPQFRHVSDAAWATGPKDVPRAKLENICTQRGIVLRTVEELDDSHMTDAAEIRSIRNALAARDAEIERLERELRAAAEIITWTARDNEQLRKKLAERPPSPPKPDAEIEQLNKIIFSQGVEISWLGEEVEERTARPKLDMRKFLRDRYADLSRLPEPDARLGRGNSAMEDQE